MPYVLPALFQTFSHASLQRLGNGSLKRIVTHNQVPPPPPILPRSLNKKLKLFDIDPLELARQLTILDNQLLLNIRATKILRSQDSRVEGSQETIDTIRSFNRVRELDPPEVIY